MGGCSGLPWWHRWQKVGWMQRSALPEWLDAQTPPSPPVGLLCAPPVTNNSRTLGWLETHTLGNRRTAHFAKLFTQAGAAARLRTEPARQLLLVHPHPHTNTQHLWVAASFFVIVRSVKGVSRFPNLTSTG